MMALLIGPENGKRNIKKRNGKGKKKEKKV